MHTTERKLISKQFFAFAIFFLRLEYSNHQYMAQLIDYAMKQSMMWLLFCDIIVALLYV